MKTTLLISISALVSGCASVGVTPVTKFNSREKNCQLDIYPAATDVKRSFQVACLIDARTGSSAFDDKTISGAINLAKPKACHCGADALILENGKTEGANLSGWGYGAALIKAIKYQD